MGWCFIPCFLLLPLGLRREGVIVSCLVGDSSGILIGVDTGVSQVKCVSRYWELTLWNGDGFGRESEKVHRREEIRVFHRNLLCLQGMGQRVRRGHH